jgi:anti-anti-sigma regulatory factor
MVHNSKAESGRLYVACWATPLLVVQIPEWSLHGSGISVTSPEIAVLVVKGRPDSATVLSLCDRLHELILANGADVVVCEVGELELCGLEAVRVLAQLALVARRLGSRLQLAHPCGQLVMTISACGLDQALPLYVAR